MVSLAHTRKSMSLGAVASSARLMCCGVVSTSFGEKSSVIFGSRVPATVWSSDQIGKKSTKGTQIAGDRLRSQRTPHFALRYPALPFRASVLASRPGTDIDPET